MFQVRTLHKLVCAITGGLFFSSSCRDSFDIMVNKAEDLNMWQIPFKQVFFKLLEIFHAKLSSYDAFIACYWFCLITATIGLGEAITEFVKLYSDESFEPSTFWNRSYHHIPLEFRRQARYAGAILNITSSLFQFYGFVNLRAAFVVPWIVLNAVIIVLEVFFWISSLITKKTCCVKQLMSIMFLILRFAIVFHVKLIIQELPAENWT